jgi:hypothetical protein
VTVNSSALPRLQDDLVDPERSDAQLTSKWHEPIPGVGVQPRAGGAALH